MFQYLKKFHKQRGIVLIIACYGNHRRINQSQKNKKQSQSFNSFVPLLLSELPPPRADSDRLSYEPFDKIIAVWSYRVFSVACLGWEWVGGTDWCWIGGNHHHALLPGGHCDCWGFLCSVIIDVIKAPALSDCLCFVCFVLKLSSGGHCGQSLPS